MSEVSGILEVIIIFVIIFIVFIIISLCVFCDDARWNKAKMAH